MRPQDGARNPWSAPTTELWAPTAPALRVCRGDSGAKSRGGQRSLVPCRVRRVGCVSLRPGFWFLISCCALVL